MTHRLSRWGRAGVVGWAMLMALNAYASIEFDALERSGSIRVDGHLEYQDYDFSRSMARSDGIGFHNAGLDVLDESIDLPGLSLALPYVAATGMAWAHQRSEYNGTTLLFEASNHVSIIGEAGIGALSGQVMAASSFQATFLINAATAVDLTLSSIVDQANTIFSFSLVRQTGEVAWDQTSIDSGDGQRLDTFTRRITLEPGFYTLNSTLKAMGGIDPGTTNAIAMSSAMFMVTAVPEPEALLLLTAGMATIPGVAWVAGLRRRSHQKAQSRTA